MTHGQACFLDNAVDPTAWVLFEMCNVTAETSYISHRSLRPTFTKIEKTYNGRVSACAKGGRADCQFIGITVKSASEGNVGVLLDMPAVSLKSLKYRSSPWVSTSLE